MDCRLAPASAYDPVDDIAKMSLLMWGEHCVECAAPSCFTSCDLYQPRPDSRCRRLTYGNAPELELSFRSRLRSGGKVAFKKWGKISVRGNTLMLPAGAALLIERMISFSAPLANAAGALMYRLTRDSRWSSLEQALLERLGRWLHRRSSFSRQQPEVFLLEVYNPMDVPVRIQLNMIIAAGMGKALHASSLPPPFRSSVTLPPGYSRHEFGREHFSKITDCGLPFDVNIIPDGEGMAHIVFLTADFVVHRKVACVANAAEPKIKCVVWDLDNTMWNGILLESEEVALGPHVLELLRYFDERGVLLSIASKNDEPSAWRRLEELGIANYFLYPQINWMPKSENIKVIAEQLNIGLDTFAFIDDNPFELEEVSRALRCRLRERG